MARYSKHLISTFIYPIIQFKNLTFIKIHLQLIENILYIIER